MGMERPRSEWEQLDLPFPDWEEIIIERLREAAEIADEAVRLRQEQRKLDLETLHQPATI